MKKLFLLLATLLTFIQPCVADSFSYDALNRLSRATFANGAAIDYIYDATGNLLSTANTSLFSAPDAPTAVTATSGNGSADISFVAPANNGGDAITGYTATSTPGGITDSCTSPCSSVTVSGLTNGTAYTFIVTATSSAGTSVASAASNAVTPKASQTIGAITFTPATLTVGGTTTASATATSNLTVSFSSTTTGVCTVSGTNGSTVTGVAAGTCTISADQAGGSGYSAASPVTQNLTVSKATPVITWSAPSAISYGTALSATQLNATANVAGSFAYTPASGAVPSVGTQTLSVSFTPTDTANYNTQTGSVSLTVNAVIIPTYTYTVSFDANGGSGTLPTQANVATSGTFAVSAGTGLTRAGYTFNGWNDGTSAYAASATYTMGAANVTLTAQWAATSQTVTYALGGGTGTLPTQANVATGGTFAAAAGAGLTRTGYTFNGWSDGTNTYAASATYMMGAANVTLTAQWTALPSVTVAFGANGGTGTMAAQTTNVATALTGNAFTRTGYTFAGWNTVALGGGTTYADGASYPFTAATTLYAQWSALTYTVSYNGNGHTAGSAPADNNRYTTGSTVAVQAGAGTFAKTGHTFAGWNSAADGSGTPYSGSFAIGAGNVTLYAQWSANTACGSAYGGTFTTAPATGLCASGSASGLSASGTGWTWTCTNGAAVTNCTANSGTLSLAASGELAFGKVSLNTQSTVQMLTVLNNGTMPVDIGQIAVTAGSPPFSLKSDACSATRLASGSSCILKAVFTPASNGVVNGTVNIPSNATAGALSTSLTGEGVTPTSPLASVSAQALSFGSISVGSVSTEQAVTVKNTGTSDLVIGTVTRTGAEFVMTSNGCSGLTLVVNTSCILKTKLTPLSTGAKTGNINLPSNDPNAPSIDIALDGTGMTAPQPAISVSSDNISFAKVTVTGTATQTTTVTNQGTAGLNIGAIAIAGTDLAHFGTANDTCSNTRVAAAASCTFDTTFTPGVPGSYTGVVTIPSDDPNTPAFNLSLDGTTGSLAGSDVNSTGATVKDLVVVDGLTSTGGLSVDKALSFTATGVSGSAEFTLTFDSLPSNPVIYKIVGSAWKQLYPANTCTGASGINLDTGTKTLTFTLADNSDCDSDPTVGTIKDPVALVSPALVASGQTIGTISFSPATLTVGGTTTASATATSGLTVSFSSTTTGICTVSGTNGSTVTGVAGGTCTIAADQAGDSGYSAATQVRQDLTVSAAAPAPAPTPAPVSVPTCTLTASTSSVSAGGIALLTVSCSPAATAYAWSSNTGFGSTTTVGTVSPTASTTYSVTGSNAGGAGNTASTTVTVLDGVPLCTLSASPETISAGASSTLTASCTPEATSYVWSATACASSSATCSVIPAATTTYTVTGSNAAGAGEYASGVVTVSTCTSASPDSDGDGIPDCVESAQGLNPSARDNDIFGNNQLFVMQQYRDFLSREGELAGIDYWIGAVQGGVLSRAQLIESFFNSEEFDRTGAAKMARLYFACFGRIPGYDGLVFWINRFKEGATLVQIAEYFVQSDEFVSLYGNSLSNDQFVSMLYYNVLQRAPDTGGQAAWLDLLNSGTLTRGEVMSGFSESLEYRAASADKIVTTMIYVGMLHRTPDQVGFDNWMWYLYSGHSTQDLINGFLAAPEYQQRFMP